MQPIIDCDLHNEVPTVQALFPYLPMFWQEYISQSGFKGPTDSAYPSGAATSARPGTQPPSGPPGSDLQLMREQSLDPWEVEYGILNCTYAVESLHNPDAAAALASAVNDWQIAEWLEPEPRLKASIVVPIQVPDLAIREIERVASHPGFVQVALPIRVSGAASEADAVEVGRAIARNNLVAGLQFGGVPGVPPTPTGWPSYFMEEYVDMAGVFATQVTSIVCEGVFDRFPSLKVALIEAGFTWLPAHMWRFDKEWKNLRRLVPWVKRPPSEYIREHFCLTVQPLDAPASTKQLLEVVEQLGSDDMLMYASHFPRVHAADPEEALIRHLPESLASKIRSENARALYGL